MCLMQGRADKYRDESYTVGPELRDADAVAEP